MPDPFNTANSLSVAASAGSGKTWQLTARIVRLLLAGTPPGEILALTFTRKAAAEMRNRLNARLCRLAQADNTELDELLAELGIEATAELRQRARALYGTQLFTPYPLRAMTLHAFCHDLLSRFALEAGLSPGFTLIENDTALLHRAWRRVQENIVRKPEGAQAKAMGELIELGCGPKHMEELVTGFLSRRSDWWAFTEASDDPGGLAESELRRHLGTCDRAAAYAIVDAPAFNVRFGVLQRQLANIGGTQYLKPAAFERVTASHGVERINALRTALCTKEGTPYRIPANALKKMSETERDHFLGMHGEVMQEYERARTILLAAETIERSRAACTLGIDALEQLHLELASSHALTFSELEWRTYCLLRTEGSAEWVRYKCDQKISHLLIDEFQDTSPTQWRMLLPLLEEMAAGGERARSLFIVGDTKQSIYGFRRANPRLFDVAGRWMREHMSAAEEHLDRSRRSSPAVIDFVNSVFSAEELNRSLGFREHATHREQDWGRVELSPLAKGPEEAAANDTSAFRNPLDDGRPDREAQAAAEEARQVTARIRSLLQSRVQVADADGGSHTLGYDDILVLARTRKHLTKLERALTDAGIPFVGSARGTFLETAEARDLRALLRWLDAPHHDLALAQVLRSPLFSLDDGDLASIASISRDASCNWAVALATAAERKSHLKRAKVLLERWQPLAAQLPAHDLLDRVISESDAANRYESALPRVAAARARGNLGAFMQLALEADSGRFPGLARFLRYLEELELIAEAAPDEAPPAATEGAVRILTVHAAKGLEAPAVFLVNAASIPQPPSPRWLVEWPERDERPTAFLATGTKSSRDKLTEDWLESRAARASVEEMNLLYVALTRARQFLHISGFEPTRSSKKSTWWDWCAQAMERLPSSGIRPLSGALADSRHHGNGEPGVGQRRSVQTPATAPETLRRPLAQRIEATRDTEPDTKTVQRGIGIHLLLQFLEKPGADLRRTVETRLNSAVSDTDYDEWLAQAQGLRAEPELTAFFDPSKYRKAWSEIAVQVHDSGMTGVIDRLVDDGETLWVLDYKTHSDASTDKLLEQYRDQLTQYVSAVTGLFPERKVRAGLLLTSSRRWVPLD